MSESIQDNLRRIRDRIAEAAIAAGRKPEDVTLVAVSKTKPAEAVMAALDAGRRRAARAARDRLDDDELERAPLDDAHELLERAAP